MAILKGSGLDAGLDVSEIDAGLKSAAPATGRDGGTATQPAAATLSAKDLPLDKVPTQPVNPIVPTVPVLDDVYADTGINLGTSGDDTLYGTKGDDSIFGHDGNDHVFHSAGSDYFNGGANIDTLDYSNSTEAVLLDANAGTARMWGSGETDSFIGFERYIGTGFDDIIYSGHSSDVVGGDGDDWIFSGAYGNVLDGGAGHDTVSYALSPEGVRVLLAAGDNHPYSIAGQGWARMDELSGFENIYGSDHKDTLGGDGLGNTLWGADGDDYMYGRSGDDMLLGGNGEDIIEGDDGHDVLLGGDGQDRLYGGVGRDTLFGGNGDDELFGEANGDDFYGGAGADLFIYYSAEHSTASEFDVIHDFNGAEGDRICLLWVRANEDDPSQGFSPDLLTDVPSPGWAPEFTAGTIAIVHLDGMTYVHANTSDALDADGYDQPEMTIALVGHHDLTADDFMITWP